MKTINAFMRDFLIGVIIILTASLSGCKKEEVYFADGVFPDSTIILSKISTSNNDIAEDFSVDENDLDGTAELLITTNSTTSGGNTDISQAIINFSFGHKTGTFTIDCSASTDPFIARLLTKSNTSRNDLGPYRLFSSIDGFEYMIYSTAGNAGDLDFYFLRNQPSFGTILPEVQGPSPVTLLNTSADEDYICFDLNMDTCYFTSGPDGNQDIYVKIFGLQVFRFDAKFRRGILGAFPGCGVEGFVIHTTGVGHLAGFEFLLSRCRGGCWSACCEQHGDQDDN